MADMRTTAKQIKAAARRAQARVTAAEKAGGWDQAAHDEVQQLCAAFLEVTGEMLWV